MENRALTMNQDKFDFGFAVDWMRKDLGIALETGRSLGAKLPLTALVDQFYADIQSQGGGRFDTSSLLRRLNKPSWKCVPELKQGEAKPESYQE